ncbi:acyltransferase family protein [Ancylobacter sp. G4_0304]|uniref:acyltransferase family protein n=1 Tax=Ancylobacter sp. G4_0304 TaxID=3114289 RepID=UPI0039C6FDA0
MQAGTAPERFEALDSWRGICALAVVVYHFGYSVDIEFMQSAVLYNAYLFVDFFFVLSGFVVCHAYRDRLGSRRQLGGFLLRRIGRLWPLHLAVLFALMLAVTLINVAGHHPDRLMIHEGEGNYSLHALLLNVALLNSMGFYGISWNGPAWSIGAEFYTYALFALVVIISGRRLLPVALAISLAAVGAIVLFAPSYMNSTADYGFIRCLAGFFAGVVASHLHQRLRGLPLPGATLWELAVVALAGLFIAMAGEGANRVGVQSVLAPAVFALAVLVFAREGGLVSKALRLRPWRALGQWSFSIYLIHMPLLILLSYVLWLIGDLTGATLRATVLVNGTESRLYQLGGPLASMALLAAFVLAVVALAALSFRMVEVPWRDYFARLARTYETRGRSFRLLPARGVGGRPQAVRARSR